MDCITFVKLRSPEKVWNTEIAEMGHQKAMDQTDLACIEQAQQVLAREQSPVAKLRSLVVQRGIKWALGKTILSLKQKLTISPIEKDTRIESWHQEKEQHPGTIVDILCGETKVC